MTKSIKLKNDNYVDSSSITNDRKNLKDILDVKGKYIKVKLTNNFNIPESQQVQVPWDTVEWNNFDNDYDNYFKLENGSIYIMNENIKTIAVTVSYLVAPNDSHAFLYIWQNDTQLNANYGIYARSATLIIPVQKGDRISSQVYIAGNSGYMETWVNITFFQITAI